jgi:RNA polymerase sigma-70 factor (ECF subfamily)
MHKTDISDESLMLDARNGNMDAIGVLYSRHSKQLFNFFVRLTHNRDSSADLLQNVFLRVLKYHNSFNPSHRFTTWMYQLARNCLNDYREMNAKNPVISNPENVLQNTAFEEHAQKQASEDALLYRAIECLPEEGRELLVMSKFQGLKYEEISAITGDSVANIKVKVYRSMLKLKERYFQLEEAGV